MSKLEEEKKNSLKARGKTKGASKLRKCFFKKERKQGEDTRKQHNWSDILFAKR